ncbi:biopolymer transporter ExbD [Ferrimonas sp. SCSIO 43195]|uniref:ExbD/TolR family protein n=1 Tax=Ferrimonas sp. SCSIO 43195 TaxID=2822844 RepID=UPI0020764A7C|nr:biopolymer transporter ExbD [Ferrimonas sp. SCSIO 43195]USD39463.1 biopolymer transporter ExbD [Ferrimonas sp. SCSIO 43195]
MLSDRFNQNNDTEVNMTPMLDVVFILLIFFIVSTSFVRLQKMEIQRPQANSAEVSHGTPLILTIDAAGRLFWQQQPLDIYYLPATLQQVAAQTENAQLLIVADTRTPTGITIKALDIAKQAGLSGASVATEPMDGRP